MLFFFPRLRFAKHVAFVQWLKKIEITVFFFAFFIFRYHISRLTIKLTNKITNIIIVLCKRKHKKCNIEVDFIIQKNRLPNFFLSSMFNKKIIHLKIFNKVFCKIFHAIFSPKFIQCCYLVN